MMNLVAIAAKKLLTKLLLTIISDKMIEWAFFNIAERVVKSTSNPHDDEWLAKLKDEYYKGN